MSTSRTLGDPGHDDVHTHSRSGPADADEKVTWHEPLESVTQVRSGLSGEGGSATVLVKCSKPTGTCESGWPNWSEAVADTVTGVFTAAVCVSAWASTPP